jgi:DNA adenine methylase
MSCVAALNPILVLGGDECQEPEMLETDPCSQPDTHAADPLERLQFSSIERPLLTGRKRSLRWDSMSPLRYPGSKRKMLPAIRQLIEGNIPKPKLFVEPFCGGASVSLGLLEMNVVERVLLSDLDPLVASFWIEATTNAGRLIEDMFQEPVTVERWDYWRKTRPRSTRNLALKCLFLNRTTFSGILGSTAGPIGGRAQTSKHRIDCRFQKDALARRIRNVERLANEGRIIGAYQAKWQEAVIVGESAASAFSKDETVLYLDPPYIEKASRLYDRPFGESDHRELATHLSQGNKHRWILSYDEEPLVLELYRGMEGVKEYGVTHHYTMQGSRRRPIPGREIVFTSLPIDPT